jgi:predicted nuclease with TOPRIM domain
MIAIPLAAVDPAFTAIVGVLLGGGAIQAIVHYRKAGPEIDQVVSQTLITVNEHLRKELELRDVEIERLRKRLADLRKDFNALEDEFRELSSRTRTHPPQPAT